jgi:ABC-type antimicrobial peptide transport system permease subunit
MERGGFVWGATLPAAKNNEYFNNPWTLLDACLPLDDNGRRIIPVVIDANTATYSLKVGVGEHLTVADSADREWSLRVVGVLKNSVLQGKLLVSEENFLRLFPEAGGYRYFLMDRKSPEASRSGDVAQLLESTLADAGFDAAPAREQLAAFLAVQNTYLSTFQSLGALGLLLGTVGLAVVQLRSVLERRGELALMRAGGFPRGRLTGMVVWENAVLLLGGLTVGCIAAAVALVPQWAPQQASVPWSALAAMLGTIAVVGLAAGWLATRSALRAPILPALRGD